MTERKKHDDKYRQSEKGKKNKEKWNCWSENQGYYKEKPCISCGNVKKIVSRGRCDACRKREKNKLDKS